MESNEPVYVGYGEVLVATENAILVALDADLELWVPKSTLGVECALEDKGDRGDLIIPLWLAEREGLDFDPV